MEEEKTLTLKSLEKEINSKVKKLEEKISSLEKKVREQGLVIEIIKRSLRSKR